MTASVHLGYEVKSGESVEIPVAHMVVTGQTQQSGKTTTLEALIGRSDLPAIAFLTKRGEASFAGKLIAPYFRERADWQFVQSILESTMHEKMKFERAWIVRACQGATTLAQVQRNVAKLQDSSHSSLSKDIYMLLGEYLERVVPLIASLPRTDRVDLDVMKGLAIMDLVRYPEELQMLVIASTLEWIHKNSAGVVTVIPEAWKFIPESKNTPVKHVAEKLAREGAALKNFIWIDSQDIAGVAKLLLRSCSVWLIGVQREANEIKRALANMPEGMKRPKAGDVATLSIGQFFCCHGYELRKVYVQPLWMDPEHAQKVARGEMSPYELARVRPGSVSAFSPLEIPSYSDEEEETMSPLKQYTEEELIAVGKPSPETEPLFRAFVRALIPFLNGNGAPQAGGEPHGAGRGPAPASTGAMPNLLTPSEHLIVMRVIDQIRRDPVTIRLAVEKPAIEVTIKRKVIAINGSTIKGKMATLIHEGWFQQRRSQKEIRGELIRRGMGPNTGGAFTEPLNELVQEGFLFRAGGDMYELAPDAEVRVVQA